MAVSHNACTLVQVIWKELVQPATSRRPMHPCTFSVGPETMNGNDALIGESVHVYIGNRLGIKYILYCTITPLSAGRWAIVSVGRFI